MHLRRATAFAASPFAKLTDAKRHPGKPPPIMAFARHCRCSRARRSPARRTALPAVF